MSSKRTTLIYGNCMVFSPDNKLMFRCLEKRAKWYLSRNLAVIIGENPLSIRLTFIPKGTGESMDVLKMERYNKCVVCGIEDLVCLTRHHLVPFAYRQFFPNSRKRHSSLFVIPICRDCHMTYENKYAYPLKKVLAEAYNAPFNSSDNIDKSRAISIINCFLQYSDQVPTDRQIILKGRLSTYLESIGRNSHLDFSDKVALEALKNEIKKETKIKDEDNHGKIVVANLTDLDQFEKMWGKHFIDNMKPKYMPEYILKTLNNLA